MVQIDENSKKPIAYKPIEKEMQNEGPYLSASAQNLAAYDDDLNVEISARPATNSFKEGAIIMKGFKGYWKEDL
jgi:hypothetical protein